MRSELVASVAANMDSLLPAHMSRRSLVERMERCVECLEETRKVDWEDRERYLMELQVAVVRLHNTHDEDEHGEAVPTELLQRLRRPLEAQVRDLRSAIVREACKLLAVCVDCLQAQFAKTATGLIPVLLDLVASGNKVIAGHIDQCCAHLFRVLRLPAVLPRLISLLKESKSKDVREASMAYLHICLSSWSTKSLDRHVDLLENVLPRVLQDASPTVRAKARESFLYFKAHFPERAKTILVRLDERTQRALQKAMQNHSVEIPASPIGPPGPRARRARSTTSLGSAASLNSGAHDPWSPRGSVSSTTSSNTANSLTPRPRRSRYAETKTASSARARTAPRQRAGSSAFAQSSPKPHVAQRVRAMTESAAQDVDQLQLHEDLPRSAADPLRANPPTAPSTASQEAPVGGAVADALGVSVDLPALVSAHRAHLNEVIASVAEELKVLKKYEKLVRAQRQSNEDLRIDPKPYVNALYRHLQVKERQVASLRADFDAVLFTGDS